VASTKRTGRTAREKYVPSEKQRAEDERIKATLDHLTDADLRKFDRVLGQAIKPLLTRTP
jgi:hypothetical protein